MGTVSPTILCAFRELLDALLEIGYHQFYLFR